MKRKNLFWIIAPCVLLVGSIVSLRFYAATEEKKSEALETPFLGFKGRWRGRGRRAPHLVVEKVEKSPVSISEIYRGFDTLVVVTLGYKGAEPARWKAPSGINIPDWENGGTLFFGKDENSRLVSSPPGFPFEEKVSYSPPQRNRATNKYEARFLMKLRHQPPSEREIVLRVPLPEQYILPPVPTDLGAFSGKNVVSTTPMKGILPFANSNVISTAASSAAPPIRVQGTTTTAFAKPAGGPMPITCIVDAPVIFMVRKPREVIKTPIVSHDSGVEVTHVEIQKRTDQSPMLKNFPIEIHLRIRRKNLSTLNHNEAKDDFLNGGGIFVNSRNEPIATGFTYLDRKKAKGTRNGQLTLFVEMPKVSTSERDLALKQVLFPNNAWPLEIRIPLRHDGKEILGTLSQSQIQTAPAKARGT